MNAFQTREQAFENKFAHDAELDYKIKARAFKKLGLWAASLIDLKDWIALDYANGIVEESLEYTELKVAEIIVADLRKGGIKDVDAEDVLYKLTDLLPEARDEIYAA